MDASVRRAALAAFILLCVLAAAPASAQLSSGGLVPLVSSGTVASAAIKGTDSGYFPPANAWLVVGSCYGGLCPGAFGAVYGVFVNSAGAPVTGPFAISPGSSEGHFPRVRYSQALNGGAGAFLVTWLEEGAGGANSVRARIVAWPGVPLGGVATLNDGTSHAWIESAAAVGYSPTSQRFLVAWRTYPNATYPAHVAARLVDINGNPVEGVLQLSAGFGRDPGVAWSSATNLFGVSFNAENSSGTAGFTGFALVPPVNAAAFTRNSFNQVAGFTYISDVDYNPYTGRFVMIWHQYTAAAPVEVRAAEMDQSSAQVLTTGAVSYALPGYDAHSLAFNPVSGTFGLSSINGDDDIVALELNSRGVPTSALTLVGPGVTGRYPRISSSSAAPQFNISFSNGFLAHFDLMVSTSSTGGGPAGEHPAPGGGGGTPPPTGGCTTPQPGPDWVCVNGGWIPGTGGGTPPPTGSCTTPQPGAGWTCVNGSWLPPSGGSGGCTTPQPGADWVCVNGGWIPGTGGGTGGCTTPQPGAGWTCVNGNWLPPSGGGGGCTTPQPGPDWVCVNGAWLPGSSSGGGGGCTTPQPGAGWTCVNGGWLPPGTTGGCTTPQPGPDWVCVNGGWIPGTGGGGGGCTTPQPGADWVCVNGGWIPGTGGGGGCTTPQPGADWVCVNGGWIPGSGGGGGGCTTPQPGAGWTCVNGGWLPPNYTCTTPQPGPTWTCVNGNWLPPSEP